MEPGEFLYQSDQEIFMVVIEENDDSYVFAVHGWREVDKNRLESYLAENGGTLYTEHDTRVTVEEHGTDEQLKHYEEMVKFFRMYADADTSGDGPHTTFGSDETP
jgi:hypothetical protein